MQRLSAHGAGLTTKPVENAGLGPETPATIPMWSEFPSLQKQQAAENAQLFHTLAD